jgi:ribonuclease P protein component
MIGRLLQAADFQRLLETPPRRRSAHFCVHFVAAGPSRPVARPAKGATSELSTDSEPNLTKPVDKSGAAAPPAVQVAASPAAPEGCWLGCLVPKRHARRAVTRSLLKRQMRAAAERHADTLAPGLWLLRLRSGFATSQFPSASSDALREAARRELDTLLQARARAPA